MVYVQKCDTYDYEVVYEKIKEMFQHLGYDKYLKPELNVCIKPNLVAKKKPEEAATTHPSLVYAVARLFVESGAKVLIAESPGGLYDKKILKGIYKTTGIEEAAEMAGALLNYDLTEAEVECEDNEYIKRMNLITPIVNADLVVNIAKLKTHGMMAYTGSVKNMFGCIAGLKKAEYHFNMPDYDSFANCIIDICLAADPQINIIDAIVGMEKDGPTAGDPKKMDLIIAGDDPFKVDSIAATLIKADIMRIPVLRNAIRRGLCPESHEEVEILGEDLEECEVKDFIINYHESKSLYFFKGRLGKWLTNIISPKPVFDKKLCKSCGECAKCCPAKVITVEKGKCAEVDLVHCIRCYCCQELCPFKAVSIKKPLINKLFINS